MINLRHLLYGLSMASYLHKLPLYWRVLLAYLLTDEAYAISIRRFSQQPLTLYSFPLAWHRTNPASILASLNDYRRIDRPVSA